MQWSDIYLQLAKDLNDPVAWNVLEHVVRAWAHAALRQHGREVVEDAVADTCSTIAVTFDRAHGPDTFRGFALGIFYNVRRRAIQMARVPFNTLDDVELAAPEPDSGPDPDDLAMLRSGLEALPPREVLALSLRFFAEKSSAEIGAELGVSEVNARRIVCNALARLRRHVAASRGHLVPAADMAAVR